MTEQIATIKLSDTPYVVLPKKLGKQIHWRDGQKVRIQFVRHKVILASDTLDEFEQKLEAYQATNDENLADALLDMLEGSLGESTPDEYDPNLKWGGYYEGR